MEKKMNNTFTQGLLDQNRKWLSAYILSLTGSPDDSDDLIQKVFVRALEIQDTYNGSSPLGAWLRGIAKNIVKEYWRSLSKEPLVSTEKALEYLDNSACRAEGYSVDERHENIRIKALRHCFKNLTGRMHSMLKLKYFKQKTSSAIAAVLNMKASAVDMALSRARKVLFNCIESRVKGEV
jgi:RNA polymerase sigma-70 factor (ECF subfamily)